MLRQLQQKPLRFIYIHLIYGYYVSGIFLGAGVTSLNKSNNPYLFEAHYILKIKR